MKYDFSQIEYHKSKANETLDGFILECMQGLLTGYIKILVWAR
jgi:hypothetical protein